jgi:glycosyltransferase involved in cell wall biosynthesis
MTPPALHLVVPCYNEAARLPTDAFAAFLHSSSGTVVLFVNDGSTDGTAGVLARLVERAGSCARVLALPDNVGKAEAVRQGILAALHDGAALVGYWDADLSTPLSEVTRFLAVFDARPAVDVVMGARVQLLGRQVQRRVLRHYAGRVFATGASLALGVPVYDTQCGAKIFRSCEAVARAFRAPFRSRWAFDVEILARYTSGVGTAEIGTRVYEMPLEAWRDVPGSKVGLLQGFRAGLDLLRIGAARRTGRMR